MPIQRTGIQRDRQQARYELLALRLDDVDCFCYAEMFRLSGGDSGSPW